MVKQFIGVEAGENILEGYTPVVKLGIQAPSGTIFHINDGGPIQIGPFGIYELDLSNVGGQIHKLVFNAIDENNNIQVDILYKGGNAT